jgi:hypothetical protein
MGVDEAAWGLQPRCSVLRRSANASAGVGLHLHSAESLPLSPRSPTPRASRDKRGSSACVFRSPLSPLHDASLPFSPLAFASRAPFLEPPPPTKAAAAAARGLGAVKLRAPTTSDTMSPPKGGLLVGDLNAFDAEALVEASAEDLAGGSEDSGDGAEASEGDAEASRSVDCNSGSRSISSSSSSNSNSSSNISVGPGGASALVAALQDWVCAAAAGRHDPMAHAAWVRAATEATHGACTDHPTCRDGGGEPAGCGFGAGGEVGEASALACGLLVEIADDHVREIADRRLAHAALRALAPGRLVGRPPSLRAPPPPLLLVAAAAAASAAAADASGPPGCNALPPGSSSPMAPAAAALVRAATAHAAHCPPCLPPPHPVLRVPPAGSPPAPRQACPRRTRRRPRPPGAASASRSARAAWPFAGLPPPLLAAARAPLPAVPWPTWAGPPPRPKPSLRPCVLAPITCLPLLAARASQGPAPLYLGGRCRAMRDATLDFS